MKHFFLIAVALFVVSSNVYAAQISENEAMARASAFGAKAVSSRLMSTARTSSAMTLAYTAKAATASDNCFYVFNRGENDGYIIVSADSRANAILGYADSGSFDYNNMPENMRWWFSEYQREIQYLINHPELKAAGSAIPKCVWTKEKVTALLDTTVWDQNSPFNDDCPVYTGTTKAYTGCVATAMAQVMYFHKCPVTGTGSTSYTSKTHTLSLSSTFSDHTYDWANMLPIYTANATTAQKAAVALLVKDCGYAVNMDYGSTSDGQSSASGFSTPIALTTNFGYDKGISWKQRNYYSISEWDSILHAEVYAKRPVLYFGATGANAGHAFVLDGYTPDGYYHINWGWSGMSNGYFLTTALTPPLQGIGGSTSGFNYGQSITVGIQPATASPVLQYEILRYKGLALDTAVVKGSAVSIPWQISNQSIGNDLTCTYLGFRLFNSKGEEVDNYIYAGTTLSAPTVTMYKGSMSYKVSGATANYTAPSDLAAGEYHLYFQYMDASNVWHNIRMPNTMARYITLTVRNDSNIYSTKVAYALAANNIKQNTKLYYNKRSSITTTVTNIGDSYNGAIYLKLFAVTGAAPELTATKGISVKSISSTASFTSDPYIISLDKGSSQDVTFKETITAAAGNYVLRITDANGNAISSDVNVTVNAAPAAAALAVTATSFPDYPNNIVPKDHLKLQAVITNTGGYYSGTINGYIFNTSMGTSLTAIDPQVLMIDANETDTLNFTGNFAAGISGTSYVLYLRDVTGAAWLTPSNKAQITFTITTPTSVSNVAAEGFKMYPVPAVDVLNVEAGAAISNVTVYSVTGAQVINAAVDGNDVALNIAALPAGSYILKAQTAAGTVVKRFVKK
jgi:hypothetical protein